MTSVSSSVNPSGIVVPAGGLQQGGVSMTTINSQVVSGKSKKTQQQHWHILYANTIGFCHFSVSVEPTLMDKGLFDL